MSREVRIRYTFKRKEDGHIWQEITPIECLEGKGDKPFILNNFGLLDLIGRDLWTGLKDKNNIDIYEGDIVIVKEHYEFSGKWSEQVCAVSFNNGAFVVDSKKFHDYITKVKSLVEVIGNIYQNPELLNTNT